MVAPPPRSIHDSEILFYPAQVTRTAQLLSERGITANPLKLDDEGFPKKPIREDYPLLRPYDNLAHDWTSAQGLGIVLDRPSGCLAVIDVDDVGLAEFLCRQLQERGQPPLMAQTARDRLHVYVQEPEPSWPKDLEVRYQGRACLVQILALGCQVAAPPTPGYAWVDPRSEALYGAVEDVWRRISLDLGLPYGPASRWSGLKRERSRGPTTAQLRQAAR